MKHRPRSGLARPGFETIVVRGDLFSDSGYGRATRALSLLLGACCRHIYGVSLHEHAARKTNAFPFTVVSGTALTEDARFEGCCVVHVCLPASFVAVPNAHNVGYFFWETEQFPPREFWKAKLKLMDELWAPSRWQAALLERTTGRHDIPVVPWPQDMQATHARPLGELGRIPVHPPQEPEQLASYLLRLSSDPARAAEQRYEQAEHEAGRSSRFDPAASPRLADVLADASDTFLAIQTDAPRKGLSLLLTAWMLFRQTPEGRRAKLLIKASSIDVTIDMHRLHFHMSIAARRLMRRLSQQDSGIYLIYARLSDDELRSLIASSSALISATMGEGFGGPLVEAFQEGVPVICPDHTSCADILGPHYPLSVAHTPYRQKLWNNMGVYSPSSVWNLVDDEALVRRLQELARMSIDQRRALVATTRSRLDATMGNEAVGQLLARLLLRSANAHSEDKSSDAYDAGRHIGL